MNPASSALPSLLARFLIVLLAAVALVGLPLSEELTWGFLYPALLPPWLRVVAAALLLVTAAGPLAPRVGRRFVDVGRALDRADAQRVVVVSLVIALVLFLLFQSRTVYGDGGATLVQIEDGELINWKEPLDRLFSALLFRAGQAAAGWSAAAAVATLSTVAGLVWVGVSIGVARTVASDSTDRLLTFGLLVTPGLMQLFFGNIENYSLLAAGILVYLWAGMRFLERRSGFLAPSLALGITCWVHLSAAWLLPTLAYLFAVRVSARRTDSVQGSPARWVRQGLVGLGVPTAVTVGLATALPTLDRPSLANFGGGDGRMFVPLFDAGGNLEKFTLFGVDHLIALANEVLLVCPAAALIVVAYLVASPPDRRSFTPTVRFVGLCAALLGVYAFVFNPDMAIFDVGVRNEWDLLSPFGVPLVTLSALLLVGWESDAERRRSVGLLAIAASTVLTGSWVLHNARFFES